MPHPTVPLSLPPATARARRAALALVALALVAAGLSLAATPAGAAVTRLHGFRATVEGWTSWYGSYGMGPLGVAWCIDHGIRAPDPAFAYVPTDLPGVDDDTRVALAWAAGRHGGGTDPVAHAGLMLALHDLMGARYPTGRLDVDRLTVARMAGFGGHEAAVLDHARHVKADALAHRHLRGPLALTIEGRAAPAGTTATATLRITDAAGQPVPGLTVSAELSGADPATASGTTAADGTIAVAYRAVAATVGVEAQATVPALAPDAWASTTTAAQRVIRAGLDQLSSTASFEEPPHGWLEVTKRGDAEPHVPVEGARFELRDAQGRTVATLRSRADGTAAAVRVPSGRYELHETRAPAGYRTAGPWPVRIPAGETITLTVLDEAIRGDLAITKVDGVTGEPIAGARLEVHRDDGAGGAALVAEITTGAEPVELADLLPGPHRITEVEAPPGYRLPSTPRLVQVHPGERAEVALDNEPRSGLQFAKVPDGAHDPAALWLAGAVLVVTDEDGTELARCTTGPDGACATAPDAVTGGATVCWHEARAPVGWGVADGGCLAAGPAGTTVEVEVRQPSLHGTVVGAKHDVTTGAPIAGATYDLWRLPAAVPPPGSVGPGDPDDPDDPGDPGDSIDAGEAEGDLPDRLGPPGPSEDPEARAHPDPARWVGVATSDADGRVVWPPQVPGFTYCAVERTAPVGYLLDPEPRCTDGDLPGAGHLLISLPDRPEPTDEPPAAVAPAPPIETVRSPEAPQAPPRSTPPHRASPPPVLPRTGTDPLALALIGGGLCVLGLAALGGRPVPGRHGPTTPPGRPALVRYPSAPAARRSAMRAGS